MSDKRIHLYPINIETNIDQYWPTETTLHIHGSRTEKFNGNHLEVVVHIQFSWLGYFVKCLMAPYKKAVKAMLGIKTEVQSRLDDER